MTNAANQIGVYTVAMPRKRIWIENRNFLGFAYFECNWIFKPSDTLGTESLDEMKRKFEAQLDKEFAAHVGAEAPKRPSSKD